jgi:hypothetical protein
VATRAAAERAIASFDAPTSRREVLRATAAGVVAGAGRSEIESAVDHLVVSGAAIQVDGPEVGRWLKSHAGNAIPPATRDARLVSPELFHLERMVSESLAHAASLRALSLSSGRDGDTPRPSASRGRLFASGPSVGTTAGRRLTELCSVEEAVCRAVAERVPVVGVAATGRAAAHLEGIFGIPVVAPERAVAHGGPGVFLVADEAALTVRARAQCIERSNYDDNTVIFLPRSTVVAREGRGEGLREPDDGALRDELSDGAVELAVRSSVEMELDAGRVWLAPDLRTALALAVAEQRAAEVAGRSLFVVTADPLLAQRFGNHGRTPGALSPSLERDPDASLVVVGGMPLLATTRHLPPSERRTHVVVAREVATASQRERYAQRVLYAALVGRDRARDRGTPRIPAREGDPLAVAHGGRHRSTEGWSREISR